MHEKPYHAHNSSFDFCPAYMKPSIRHFRQLNQTRYHFQKVESKESSSSQQVIRGILIKLRNLISDKIKWMLIFKSVSVVCY